MQRVIWFGMLMIVSTLAVGNYPAVDAYQSPTPFPTPRTAPAASMLPASLAEVQALMVEYADCLLACFWGFIPGQTSATEVIAFTQPDFEVSNLDTQHYFPFYLFENEDDLDALFWMGFTTENERLSRLRVYMNEPYRWLPENTYEIDHLLATVGSPTETSISINVTRGRIFVTLNYADVGLIRYEFGLEAEEELISRETPLLLCPRLDNNLTIDLYLPHRDTVDQATPRPTPDRKTPSVQALTKLDTATFLRIITEDPNDCIKMRSLSELYGSEYVG